MIRSAAVADIFRIIIISCSPCCRNLGILPVNKDIAAATAEVAGGGAGATAAVAEARAAARCCNSTAGNGDIAAGAAEVGEGGVSS